MLKLALRPRPPLQPHSTPCSQQRCVQCLQDPQPRCAADPQPRRAEGRTSRLRLLMPVITWSKTLSDSTCSLSWCSEQLCLPKTRTLAVSSRRRMVPDKASPLMTFRGTKVEIIYLEYNQSCFFIYFEKRRRDRWVQLKENHAVRTSLQLKAGPAMRLVQRCSCPTGLHVVMAQENCPNEISNTTKWLLCQSK